MTPSALGEENAATGNPNIAARLLESAHAYPDRDAIVAYRSGRPRRITYGAFVRHVAAVAAGLAERGIAPGDSVLLFVPMSIDLYVVLLAIHHLGATAVFLDAWAGRKRLEVAIRAARPQAFVGSPRAHLLRITSPALRAIPRSIVVGRGWSSDRLARPADARPPARVAPEAPALVTFTTGTTGVPKAAVRSHAFLWAQHLALHDHLRLRPEDVDLAMLPVFALSNFAVGCTTVIPEFDPRRPAEIDPQVIHRQMLAEAVTTTTGSPAFFENLATWCRDTGQRLHVRALHTGGAPVLPPLARLLTSTVTGEVHVVYGSTEAEPIAGIEARAMLGAMEEEGEGLCVGMPVQSIRLKIVRPWDSPIELGRGGWEPWELALGHVGEIVVTGNHVLPGYAGDLEAERANKVRDGDQLWHRTGDAGRLDAQGRLWLMGRIRSRVVRDGVTWWGLPAEIRALELPTVRHAAYVGRPDARMGQRAALCVETGSNDADDTLRSLLADAVAPYPMDEMHAFAHLPRDPRHRSKTDTGALLEQLGRRPR